MACRRSAFSKTFGSRAPGLQAPGFRHLIPINFFIFSHLAMSDPDAPKAFKQGDVEFNLIDDEYIERMTAFKIECRDGKGEPMACHNCGEFLSVIQNDREAAASIFTQNCDERSFGPSCFNLAKLFLRGLGVQQNDVKAESYFSKACKQGHSPACYHEGMLVYTRAMKAAAASSGERPVKNIPENVLPEVNRGVGLLTTACEGGLSDACSRVGMHYLADTSARDAKKALEFLKDGCDKNNHPQSCYNLAMMYKRGDGVTQSDESFESYKARTKELAALYGGFNLSKRG